jgi:hypothetical protein
MFTRIIAMVILLALVNSLVGCASKQVFVTLDEAREKSDQKVLGAALVTGAVITFDKEGGLIVAENRSITGIAVDGTERKTPITVVFDEVRAVMVKQFSAGKSALTLLGIAAAIGVFLIIMFLATMEEGMS